MVTVSATERPQGDRHESPPGHDHDHDKDHSNNKSNDRGNDHSHEQSHDHSHRHDREHGADRPELVLSDKTPTPNDAGRGVAARRHQTWASRFESGQLGDSGQQRLAVGRGAGWEVFSYLIAGMLAYGGLGWVVGHFTHVQLLFPIGMLVGLAISLGWIIYRYGRQ